jgi:hypothetical protein
MRTVLRTSGLSENLIGIPTDTTDLTNCMSTSSLFLVVWNGRVIPLLDEFPKLFHVDGIVSLPPCSNDLWTISRSCIFSWSSLLFKSLTTWVWWQASFWVNLLLPTLARERALSVVLCPNWRRRRHFYVFTVFFRVSFPWKTVLVSGRECHTKGWKRGGKGPKKKVQFFLTSRDLVQCSQYTSQRVVHVQSRTVSLDLTISPVCLFNSPWWFYDRE